MTFPDEPTTPTSDGSINWQLVILVCGLMMTLTVAAATGVLTRTAVPTPPAAPRTAIRPAAPAPQQPVHNTRRPVMTFVIVDSQEEAEIMKTTMEAYLAADEDLAETYDWTDFVVLRTTEEEDDFWAMLHRTSGDLEAAGTDLRVVDLRE